MFLLVLAVGLLAGHALATMTVTQMRQKKADAKAAVR